MSSIPNAIIAEAQRQGIDPALALEVAYEESRFNQNAVSSKRAIGVFQLEPLTAQDLGVNPYDLDQNIQGGVSYLRQMLAQFGDPAAALAAYDWGPENVKNAIAQLGNFSISAGPGQPSMPAWLASAPAETRNYVATILGNVQTQYTAVTAYTAAAAGVSPGGGTSTLTLPPALLPPPSPPGAFSWGTVAMVVGVILGIGLVLSEV